MTDEERIARLERELAVLAEYTLRNTTEPHKEWRCGELRGHVREVASRYQSKES